MPTNLSLWMRVPLIIAPLIVRGLGQYMDARSVENASSFEGKGKSDTKPSYITEIYDILLAATKGNRAPPLWRLDHSLCIKTKT